MYPHQVRETSVTGGHLTDVLPSRLVRDRVISWNNPPSRRRQPTAKTGVRQVTQRKPWNVLKKQPPAEIDWSTSPKDDESEEPKPRATAGDWVSAFVGPLLELILDALTSF